MAFAHSGGFKIAQVVLGLAVSTAIGVLVGFYLAFVRDLPELSSVADYRPALASHVFDRHGRPIGQFFSERRRLTPLSAVPSHVVQAFVASARPARDDVQKKPRTLASNNGLTSCAAGRPGSTPSPIPAR